MDILSKSFLRGPNLWANFPVLEVKLDLGERKDTSSEMMPGFNDRLQGLLPSLVEHRCSEGMRGGFFQRLERGTYLAHILEHVALEIQTLAGSDVGFGRARETEVDGIYYVAIQYEAEELVDACVEAGRALLLACIAGEPYDIDAKLAELRELAYDAKLGPSTAAIVAAAEARGIPATRLNRGSLVQLGYGARAHRICTAETDRTSAIAETVAQDKDLTRWLLQSAGVPVPAGRPVEDADDAWRAAEELGLPVVVKPQYGNHGRGVATNLSTREQVAQAYAAAYEESSHIMVEQFIEGDDYRMLVIDGKLIAAALREPAHVVGNGHLTIEELVAEVNRDPRRSDGHGTVLSTIKIDAIGAAVIAEQGYTPQSIPAAGVKVLIRRNGNLSTGGTATDVTDRVHPEVAARSVEAARIVGLDVAGIDIVSRDISQSMESQRAAVVEVNAGPGLRMHLQPSGGLPRPVGEAIVDSLFPPGESGRIPIAAVTGVTGKSVVTRLITHLLMQHRKYVGTTTADGLYLNGRRTDARDCSGPHSARSILLNPQVEAAVFETGSEGILREGLGFDRCDVAVVTNIGQPDPAALQSVGTIERLVKVKRTIVDVASSTGAAVLNADDPLVAAMAEKSPAPVTYFTRDPAAPLIVEHRRQGGRAVYIRDASIVLAAGEVEIVLAPLASVPFASNGHATTDGQWVLAAAAAAWGLGIPLEEIRLGLGSFGGEPTRKLV